MKILHFIKDVPSADDVAQANKSRSAGNEYKFVSEAWASENDAIPCDQIVTDDDALIKKYKSAKQHQPEPDAEPVDIELPEAG